MHRVLKASEWWFNQSYHAPKPSTSDNSSCFHSFYTVPHYC